MLNKVAGWVLFTVLLIFGLNEISHVIYHAEAPEKPGMVVEVAQASTGGADAADEKEVTIAQLMVGADAEKGQKVAKACVACHTFTKDGANKVGPNLWDIIGHPVAAKAGYSYSGALKEKASETWTYENLNAFILRPKAWSPGTKMTYGGLKNDGRRANLIAYLRSLSDDPKPLPEATAEGAGEGTAEPEGETSTQ